MDLNSATKQTVSLKTLLGSSSVLRLDEKIASWKRIPSYNITDWLYVRGRLGTDILVDLNLVKLTVQLTKKRVV
jgi:hypothetical protein